MVLRLQEFYPNFNPEKHVTSRATAWVSFPGLFIELWTKKILITLAKIIGKPIAIDQKTLDHDYGNYAAVLIDIDFAKHIPSRILIEANGREFWQSVEIQDFDKINFCDHCKIIGHKGNDCRFAKKLSEPSSSELPRIVASKSHSHVQLEWREKNNLSNTVSSTKINMGDSGNPNANKFDIPKEVWQVAGKKKTTAQPTSHKEGISDATGNLRLTGFLSSGGKPSTSTEQIGNPSENMFAVLNMDGVNDEFEADNTQVEIQNGALIIHESLLHSESAQQKVSDSQETARVVTKTGVGEKNMTETAAVCAKETNERKTGAGVENDNTKKNGAVTGQSKPNVVAAGQSVAAKGRKEATISVGAVSNNMNVNTHAGAKGAVSLSNVKQVSSSNTDVVSDEPDASGTDNSNASGKSVDESVKVQLGTANREETNSVGAVSMNVTTEQYGSTADNEKETETDAGPLKGDDRDGTMLFGAAEITVKATAKPPMVLPQDRTKQPIYDSSVLTHNAYTSVKKQSWANSTEEEQPEKTGVHGNQGSKFQARRVSKPDMVLDRVKNQNELGDHNSGPIYEENQFQVNTEGSKLGASRGRSPRGREYWRNIRGRGRGRGRGYEYR